VLGKQVLLGISEGWDASKVALALYVREGDGWRQVGDGWDGVLGSGSAWGRGLHGEGAPTGQDGPVKREGDGRSPAGVFALGPSYGYAKAHADGLPYTALDAGWECVDDPASPHYNRVLDGRAVPRDWASSEAMRREDELYRWVVEVGHNGGGGRGAPTAAGGSCIFLHVWRSAEAPTVGCTAMARPRIERLLAALAPEAAPVYVLLPRAAYEALRGPWRLP
jgi:L,D-peptidoglycan transpeptidase YkuD (ErfK/YbiS/YcfS/YnhG family)